MANRPPRACQCGGIIRDRKHRCRRAGPKPRRKRPGGKSPYGRDWRKFRDLLLSLPQFQTCADCAAEDIVTATEELHHVKKIADYPALRLSPENILPLCKTHHSIRSARGE